jgi:hypothetical protein
MSTEDPADGSHDCEEGNALDDALPGPGNGRLTRDGATLTADFGDARGNELHRLPVDLLSDVRRGMLGVFVAGTPLPALAPACWTRRSGETLRDALCDWTGVQHFVVVGPRSTRDRFDVDSSLSRGDAEHPGFPGDTTLLAGPGEAMIDVDDGVAERVDCGSGYDEVLADGADVVEGDCERSKGEGVLHDAVLGTVAGHGRTKTGRLPFYYGNSGQAVMVRISCPASASDGCGGTIEATLTRPPKVAFGAAGYHVDAGRTAWVGIAGAVDAGAFHAASEGVVRRRFFSELRARGNLKLRIVTAHGFGAHRKDRASAVVAARR